MSKLGLPWLILSDGFLLVLAALLAPVLGLDPNMGWGKGRLVAFILGLLFLGVAALTRQPRWKGLPRLNAWLNSDGLKTGWIVGHAWVLVFAVYIWFITYGNWTTWLHTSSYYDKLANSFSEGHLYIDIKPAASLLASPDPYEPENRPALQNDIFDMSLYKGKFYLYWGPAPSLLATPLKLLGVGKISDNYFVFFFYSGLLIFNTLLILKIWKRLFPETPPWAVVLCIPLIGLVGPVPWSISEPNIYDAGVGAGQFFLMGGIYWAFSAFDREAHLPKLDLFLAGSFWALAAGTRALYAITIVVLAVFTIAWMLKTRLKTVSLTDLGLRIAAIGLPLGFGAAALIWYNWARFGSPLEFGLRYQISIWNLNKIYGLLFLPSYILPNLLVYLFQPVQFTPVFPFIQPTMASDLFQHLGYAAPQLYYAGKVSGLLFSAPFLITILANLIPQKYLHPGWQSPKVDPELRAYTNYLLLAAFLTGFILLLIFFVGSMRYLLDVISPLTLFACMGYWKLAIPAGQGSNRLRKSLLFLATLLLCLSVCTGWLLAFSAETDRFQVLNPILFNRIVQWFPSFR